MVLTTSDRANYPLVSPGQKPEQLVPSAPDPVAVSASSTLATTSLALALACLVMQVMVIMVMMDDGDDDDDDDIAPGDRLLPPDPPPVPGHPLLGAV